MNNAAVDLIMTIVVRHADELTRPGPHRLLREQLAAVIWAVEELARTPSLSLRAGQAEAVLGFLARTDLRCTCEEHSS